MTDLFGFDLADGLESGECALCHALALHMRRWLDTFRREGRRDPATRTRFYAAGGFCRGHAWLLHGLLDGSGAPVADVYGRLAEQDAAQLGQALHSRRGRRGGLADELRRPAPCPGCVEEAEALPRKAAFFLELLATEAGRRRYEGSAGLCFEHLVAAVEAAAGRDAVARYLVEDWRRRVVELRDRLARYDRTRDHRFAAERTDDLERSWTDAIRRYAGPPPGWAGPAA